MNWVNLQLLSGSGKTSCVYLLTAANADPNGFIGAVPLADETALTVRLIGRKGHSVFIEPEDIRRTRLDTNATASTGGLVDFNLRHEILSSLKTPALSNALQE